MEYNLKINKSAHSAILHLPVFCVNNKSNTGDSYSCTLMQRLTSIGIILFFEEDDNTFPPPYALLEVHQNLTKIEKL